MSATHSPVLTARSKLLTRSVAIVAAVMTAFAFAMFSAPAANAVTQITVLTEADLQQAVDAANNGETVEATLGLGLFLGSSFVLSAGVLEIDLNGNAIFIIAPSNSAAFEVGTDAALRVNGPGTVAFLGGVGPSGTNGADGTPGANGSDAPTPSSDGESGVAGQNGTDGENGEDGSTSLLNNGVFTVSGGAQMILGGGSGGSGGAGGAGGVGGNGGAGADGAFPGGNGGAGGQGGIGGSGGAGGDSGNGGIGLVNEGAVFVLDDAVITFGGGSGGASGLGGHAGQGGNGGNGGDGAAGSDSPDGAGGPGGSTGNGGAGGAARDGGDGGDYYSGSGIFSYSFDTNLGDHEVGGYGGAASSGDGGEAGDQPGAGGANGSTGSASGGAIGDAGPDGISGDKGQDGLPTDLESAVVFVNGEIAGSPDANAIEALCGPTIGDYTTALERAGTVFTAPPGATFAGWAQVIDADSLEDINGFNPTVEDVAAASLPICATSGVIDQTIWKAVWITADSGDDGAGDELANTGDSLDSALLGGGALLLTVAGVTLFAMRRRHAV